MADRSWSGVSFHVKCQMIRTRESAIAIFANERFIAGVLAATRNKKKVMGTGVLRRETFLPKVSRELVRSSESPAAVGPCARVGFDSHVHSVVRA